MTQEEHARSAGTRDEWSFGRFVYDQAAAVSVGMFMIVCMVTVLVPQPRTVGQLVVWLGFGVGILSLAASVARLAGHRRIRWSGEEFTPWVPEGDGEWARQERERAKREQQAELARRSGYDYLGKLLALHAALFALVATGFHILGLSLG